jgi:hypothetical protein
MDRVDCRGLRDGRRVENGWARAHPSYNVRPREPFWSRLSAVEQVMADVEAHTDQEEDSTGAAGPEEHAPAPIPIPPALPQKLNCPYCGRKLKRDKPVERRASCPCPACKRKMWVDPYQRLFPRLCLTEDENVYVDFVMRLADLHCGVEPAAEIETVRETLRAEDGTDAPPGDVVSALLEMARAGCLDRDEEACLGELIESFHDFASRRGVPTPDAFTTPPASKPGGKRFAFRRSRH